MKHEIFNEAEVEREAIKLLENLGYEYVYGPEMGPEGEHPERERFSEVLLDKRLWAAVNRLNPGIPDEAKEQALREIHSIASPDLVHNNETFHRFLTNGIDVEFQKEGLTRGDKVWLVDFNDPANNEFLVVNQFTVVENNVNKRPDLLLFVNGLPLIVMELKNPADESAYIEKAYDQLQTYKAMIPSLFTFNALLVISDGMEAKAGSLSAGYQRFHAWKTADGKTEASHLVSQLETLITGLLNKTTLLDLARHFTVFEKTKKEDPATGITTVQTEKKIAAYHQFYSVNKAVESTLKAARSGTRKGGVVWHTQGSGKSLTMVFYAGKLVLQLNNPTIVVITDRNDLDDQLFDTFADSSQLLRQAPVQAGSREHLKDLLKVASGGIVFTTVQKFSPEDGEEIYPLLSPRENIVVIADEAHRSQYGFKAKTIIDKESGEVRTAYGFAKYMRDALPNATFIGFTGTPVEHTDKNTPAVFGDYIDVYDIARAVDDGATVRIYYESRLAKVNLEEEGKKLVEELDRNLEQEDLTVTEKAKAKWTKLEAIVGSKTRLANVAKDIINHFDARQEAFKGKAMIVTMSRRVAAALYENMVKLRPEFHSRNLGEGQLKVVMTASSDDGPKLARHHTTKAQRRILADRLKDPDNPLKMVIVVDMWLTGFDVPCLHTMYIDKPMKGHNLMQTIARVNRVYLDKPGGLIVDYLGIASDLKRALAFYAESGGQGDPTETQDQAVSLMLEKLEIIEQLFTGFDYPRFFKVDTSRKLAVILEAEEHILNLEDGKERFSKEVAHLSKAFALSIPHEKAEAIREKVAFFQAVRSRLVKFETSAGRKSAADIETAIRQVIDKAVVSDKVIDVFDAAGIKKPDISILSDEFMEEIKGMKHRSLALELLKKLLNDEIRSRAKKNLVQSKTLLEMLENALRRYRNKIISGAEILDELIGVARNITELDKRGEISGLSDDEMAFYDALAANRSAVEVLGNEKLRELAIVLVDRVRKNVTIDWTVKESVKSRMRVIVKRLLREYGYPPDKQKIATETVLKQAELYAEEWTK
ncbi:MAG: type I restriction endonuclease subunit R [Candidatus Aminicenantes bacterium]|nr:type I restriction endonuclease subunit R [Candidatus Aminicenantes bacterium]